MQDSGLHAIPKESKTKQSLILALFVHMALFAFLWIGVSWQNEEGGSIEAEVWDIKVSEAAPRAQIPEPVAEEAAEMPEPQVKEPPPVEAKIDARPDIALEEEKKRKEEKKKEEEKRREEEARKKEETKKKEAEEAKKKQLKQADQKKADAIMAEEAKRLAAKSGTGGSGTSAYSTGSIRADSGYTRTVSAKIKSNTIFNVPDNLSGNPSVEYDVELLPDGSIKNIRKRKSSGVPGFDEAVLRAIEKSAPYPQNNAGRVPSRFEISHKPKG
jgi:TonB family C-terminal domain